MKELIKNITNNFNKKVDIQEKRPGIMQLYLPVFHEDGDMIDIYIQELNGKYFLCDFGKTLQRLSYEYDIDTPNKENILDRILLENNLKEEKGNIFMETNNNSVFHDILHVTQAYSKIASMRYFKREVLESLFLEMLEQYIFSELNDFSPQKKVYPIPNRPELEIDYSFKPNGHSVYLMSIKHATQAKLATINFQAFKLAGLNFRGWAVYESFENLSKTDISLVSSASEKQFTSLDNFKTDIKYYLEKERK